MPKIDVTKLAVKTGSSYPALYSKEMEGHSQIALGDAGGLSQFGVNIVTLSPGSKSSLRHWHEEQDEFAMITEGRLTLIDDTGQTVMEVGDSAAFPAGDANGHHFVNETSEIARFLVVGTRTETETGYYSDIDMMVRFDGETFNFTRNDGSPVE